MNEYGPVLPATGGASVLYSECWGLRQIPLLWFCLPLIGLVFMGYSLFKLLKGESSDQEF